MKKILVVGSSGLVGSRFVELYSSKFDLVTPSHLDLDITDSTKTKSVVQKSNPDVIINFAAFTNVTAAEDDRENKESTCWKINVEGTENLLNSITDQKIHFINISTDMVISGSQEDPGPYKETHKAEDDLQKVTWYGFTKGRAEKLTESLGDKGSVLRITYPARAKFTPKLDFLRKPLSLFDQGKLYPLFDDQHISLTFIDEACAALNIIVNKELSGIFHASSSDQTTPYDLITYLLKKTRNAQDVVQRSHLTESVRYPKYGGLDSSQTSKTLGLKFRTSQEIVDKLIEQGINL